MPLYGPIFRGPCSQAQPPPCGLENIRLILGRDAKIGPRWNGDLVRLPVDGLGGDGLRVLLCETSTSSGLGLSKAQFLFAGGHVDDPAELVDGGVIFEDRTHAHRIVAGLETEVKIPEVAGTDWNDFQRQQGGKR